MAEKRRITKSDYQRKQKGIVLLVSLVVLVILSSMGYTLSTRLLAQRHRNQFMVDYSQTRYSCDSAVKYALATIADMNVPPLISRPNEPDFSDIFALTDEEYDQLLSYWADKTDITEDGRISDANEKEKDGSDEEAFKELFGDDFNDINDVNDTGEIEDTNSLKVRGPYSPQWPFITEPVEFEIGSAKVSIEIEDENAKYPLCWAIIEDEEIKRQAQAGFEAFCEWMDVNSPEIKELKAQLREVSEIKKFEMDLKPIKIIEEKKVKVRSKRRRRRKYKVRKTVKMIPATAHLTDYSKIFHSSLFDAGVLARPTGLSETRKESALKYMGMWGSNQVNINAAPRQVLESAFVFGGDAEKIADEIIQRRRIRPFDSIAELKEMLFRYSDSIEKCEKYITTTSNFFTIRITAVSGMAKSSAVIAVIKDGKTITRIAVLSG